MISFLRRKRKRPNMYEISVFVELEDQAKLDQLTEGFAKVLCDDDHDDESTKCPVPWFIVSKPMDAKQSKQWRNELNR